MTPDLVDRILTRLDVTGVSNEPWALAIVAALEGEIQLTAFLDKTTTIAMPAGRTPQSAAARVEPPGVYLASLTVEGFRGVGPAATLTLTPGPGLTLIVGRNGSGKSSFAEGLEFLLTGSNYRWEGRPKAWGDGWRNLHHVTTVALRADLLVEGHGTLALARTWASDVMNDVDAGVAVAKRVGGKAQTLESLGWDEALATFRPFLSYNELGSLLEEGPSKLYDALSSVRGLEELTAIHTLLVAARKQRTDLTVVAKKRADEIRDALSTASSGSSDRRLADAVKALKGPAWDVAALAALVSGRESDAGMSELDLLTRVAAIAVPDEEAISASVSRLRATDDALAAFAGTNTERSRERARLLDQALQFHAKHKGKDCPVCGTADAITSAWATATRREIDALKKKTAACEAAESGRRDAIREAQRFVSAPPPALAQAKDKGLSRLHDVRRLWLQWSEGRELDSATRLADHLESQVMELADAVRALIEEADAERKRREDVWRPAAAAIAGWLPDARAALAAKTRIEELKAAEKWWKDSSAAIRDERFAPIASRASQLWAALSRAAHVHPYELSPTRGELLTWIAGVGEVVEKTERQWVKGKYQGPNAVEIGTG